MLYLLSFDHVTRLPLRDNVNYHYMFFVCIHQASSLSILSIILLIIMIIKGRILIKLISVPILEWKKVIRLLTDYFLHRSICV
jgi:hypothetical protein